MPVNILMPALSPTMEEGTLAKWLKSEGDTIASGDIIAEIETDKATMEFEAVDEGVLGKIVVPEGTEGVKVNDLIAVLLEDGENAGDIGSAPAPTPVPEVAPADGKAASSGALPRTKGWIWPRSKAPALKAGSSKLTWKTRNQVLQHLPQQNRTPQKQQLLPRA